MKSQKGQLGPGIFATIGSVVTATVLLLMIAFVLTNSQDILQEQADNECDMNISNGLCITGNSTFAYNSTDSSQGALANISDRMGNIAGVIAAIIIITVLVMGFFGLLRLTS